MFHVNKYTLKLDHSISNAYTKPAGSCSWNTHVITSLLSLRKVPTRVTKWSDKTWQGSTAIPFHRVLCAVVSQEIINLLKVNIISCKARRNHNCPFATSHTEKSKPNFEQCSFLERKRGQNPPSCPDLYQHNLKHLWQLLIDFNVKTQAGHNLGLASM